LPGRTSTTTSTTQPRTLEAALTPEEARQLHVSLGSTITAQFAYVNIPVQRVVIQIPLHIVGIFSLQQGDPFWYPYRFQSTPRAVINGHAVGTISTLLVSTENLLSLFDTLGSTTRQLVLEEPFTLYWFYHLNPDRITISDLNQLVNGLATIESEIPDTPQLQHAPFIEHLQISSPDATLNAFYQQASLADIPIDALLILVELLVLFFSMLMTGLLIERQRDTVALLRSRGASRLQIFGTFATQSLVLSGLALLSGPALAILLVVLLVRLLLPASDQPVLQMVLQHPQATLPMISAYAVGAAAAGLFTMGMTIERATHTDVLKLRRESARSTSKPLWLRLNLDLMATLLALLGYALSLYLTISGALDVQTRQLLLSPLALLGAVCLIIACILLSLRLLPSLLAWGTRLAARNRGAATLLALAQMARAPHQALRMTLLLATASAFMIFSLILLASQAQRTEDSAAFQSGADFSGPLFYPGTSNELQRLTQAYRHIHGVIAASLGYRGSLQGGETLAIPIEICAVDPATFAQAATWNAQDSSQPLSALMQLLLAQRREAATSGTLPAIVDAGAAQALQISSGHPFTLSTPGGDVTLSLTEVAEVHFIPTVNTVSITSSRIGISVPAGGVLVDYQTFTLLLARAAQDNSAAASAPLNFAWLKTQDTPTALQTVRQALSRGPLELAPLQDRRAQREAMRHQPIYLNLIGVLSIGSSTALLLAIIGTLVASWLSVRSRLTLFSVMRALGTSPRQLATICAWEQGLIYAAALILGSIFGGLLSWLAVPALVFTGTDQQASTGAIFASQSVPPIQIVVPPWLLAVPTLEIIICGSALALMVRVASRPALGQVLRLNED
jgi:putative ABC transport system permease protein